MTLTIDRLKYLLMYDPETGLLTRRVAVSNCAAGSICGSKNSKNGPSHLKVNIDGGVYYVHRIAFFYMNGEWPIEVVDHINGDATDNRWCNIRSVSQFVNMQNLRGPTKASKTGVLGVWYDQNRKKFATGIRHKGLRICKRFNTLLEAEDFYLRNKRVMHEGCTI